MTDLLGARWWKCDFHAHTPASHDYGKGTNQDTLRRITPEEWILNFMRAGIDCVGVTDHNSGEWIDSLKQAVEKLKTSNHPEFRQIYIFPGVEITANAGIHVLAILDVSKTSADVSSLLGAVNYRGNRGESQSAAEHSVIQVIEDITKAGGVPILAHVDAANGALSLTGNTLNPIFARRDLIALEIQDPSSTLLAGGNVKDIQWAKIAGSDSHHPSGSPGQRMPGSQYTWIKMDTPSLDGLKLSLHDADALSIRCSDKYPGEQNILPELWMEEVEVQSARWMGRGKTSLKARFNPWLNAIVGGRGTGKSSLLNFMRIVLRRGDELPSDLKKDFDEFVKTRKNRNDPIGVILNEPAGETTTLRLIYRKGAARLRVNWRPAAASQLPEIEEEQADLTWREVPGDICQRFPIRIFSQKQIFAMATDPRALLRIIDEAPEVGKAAWSQEWDSTSGHFLSLQAKHRELQIRAQERPKLEGELADITQKLSVFEGAAHADILKEFQHRQRQDRRVIEIGEELLQTEQRLREFSRIVNVNGFDRNQFDSANPADKTILELLDMAVTKGAEISSSLGKLADEAKMFHENWKGLVAKSEWQALSRKAREDYESLSVRLRSQGVTDPSQYSELVKQRQILEQKIKAIDGLKSDMSALEFQSLAALTKLSDLRDTLTKSRQTFIEKALKDNQLVRIEVLPFGRESDSREVEREFRRVIEREDGFATDILSEDRASGLIAEIYRDLPKDDVKKATDKIKERLINLKKELLATANGTEQKRYGARFESHLRQLRPDALNRIQNWFPEDGLSVSYVRSEGAGFLPIGQASPGQKTAAILAFLLSHGTEPMILDQPEDDLDNHLISDLIVRQLRENKQRRQFLVATHNPNIVVNGDAELIFPMEHKNGRCCFVEPPGPGSLQSRGVRDEVCHVMEGGRTAFEKRYRRIFLEQSHM